MIKKYIFGNPFPTDAVVKDIEKSEGNLPYFETDGKGSFTFELSENDVIYGHIDGFGHLFHKSELKKLWWKGKKYYEYTDFMDKGICA